MGAPSDTPPSAPRIVGRALLRYLRVCVQLVVAYVFAWGIPTLLSTIWVIPPSWQQLTPVGRSLLNPWLYPWETFVLAGSNTFALLMALMLSFGLSWLREEEGARAPHPGVQTVLFFAVCMPAISWLLITISFYPAVYVSQARFFETDWFGLLILLPLCALALVRPHRPVPPLAVRERVLRLTSVVCVLAMIASAQATRKARPGVDELDAQLAWMLEHFPRVYPFVTSWVEHHELLRDVAGPGHDLYFTGKNETRAVTGRAYDGVPDVDFWFGFWVEGERTRVLCRSVSGQLLHEDLRPRVAFWTNRAWCHSGGFSFAAGSDRAVMRLRMTDEVASALEQGDASIMKDVGEMVFWRFEGLADELSTSTHVTGRVGRVMEVTLERDDRQTFKGNEWAVLITGPGGTMRCTSPLELESLGVPAGFECFHEDTWTVLEVSSSGALRSVSLHALADAGALEGDAEVLELGLGEDVHALYERVRASLMRKRAFVEYVGPTFTVHLSNEVDFAEEPTGVQLDGDYAIYTANVLVLGSDGTLECSAQTQRGALEELAVARILCRRSGTDEIIDVEKSDDD